MRRNLIALVFLLFSAQAHSIDGKSIEKELSKIDEAKKAGLMTDELLLIEKKLLEQKASSRTTARNATNKPKEIIKKKSFKVFKKINPKAYFTFLDKINSKEEKLIVINNKLVEVRQKLYDLKQTEPDSSDIIQLQSEIDLLEIERLKTETSVVSTRTENKLSAFKVGAIFDFYYAMSSNRGGDDSPDSSNSDNKNSLRYYDNLHDDFSLNLAEINFSASVDKTSFYLDLDFGEFAEQNAPNDEVTKHIGQAFITHNFDDNHSISVGKMYTHVGFELAKSIDNWNYSRSYAFSYGGPFWHEGIALKGSYSNGIKAGLFAYDATDSRRDNNDDKTYGAQLGYFKDKFFGFYNIIHGPERDVQSGKSRTIHELNSQYNISDSVSLAADFVLGIDQDAGGNGYDQKWHSSVAYINYKLDQKWKGTYRFESFREQTSRSASQFRLGTSSPNSITSQTITFSHMLGDKNEIRLELRHDHGTGAPFLNKNGHQRSTQDTALVAWIFGI